MPSIILSRVSNEVDVMCKKLKTEVFEAAKDGDLHNLQCLLGDKSLQERKEIVDSVTRSSTPLLISCCNGHFHIVKFLISECHVNVEKVGNVTHHSEVVEEAPPLWSAAAAGHLNIVKLLCEAGALVNNTTKSFSTPLRAACFDGYLEIVKYLVERGADIEKANYSGHTCLMIACYKGHFEVCEYLLRCNADVNAKNSEGNTALHDSAENGDLKIFKLLLMYGAEMHEDSHGITPIISAASLGNTDIVKYIIETNSTVECAINPKPNNYYCEVQHQINALELLGVVCCDAYEDEDLTSAFNLWKRAMSIRYQDTKYSILKSKRNGSISALINATEIETLEQLENLTADFDVMKDQNLLIRQRILGSTHFETMYYIYLRGVDYANGGNFNKCIQTWMFVLNVNQRMLEPLSITTQNSFCAFADLFASIISKSITKTNEEAAFYYRNALNVLQRAVKEIMNTALLAKNVIKEEEFYRMIKIIIYLIGLLCKLEASSQYDESEFKRCVYNFIRTNPKCNQGWSLLHVTCFRDPNPLCKFSVVSLPSTEVTELLIELGASVNAMDDDKNTPLHIAALNSPFSSILFRTLLKHGAHLDFRNADNKTPLQLLQASAVPDINPLCYQNLQCLCAHVILKNEIPYRGQIPQQLEHFLNCH